MGVPSVRGYVAGAFAAAALAAGPASAQDLAGQEWLLDPSLSNVYMQTVKNNAVFETHLFNATGYPLH